MSFRLVSDTTLGAATSTISITGLDNYSLLRVTAFLVKDATSSPIHVLYNSITGSGYSYQRFQTSANTLTSIRNSSQNRMINTSQSISSNGSALLLMEIAKPAANSLMVAHTRFVTNTSSPILERNASVHTNNTDTLTSLQILSNSGNFAVGTRVLVEGFVEPNVVTLTPVSFTLTAVAPSVILGTAALIKQGSYIPVITKKKVG